MIKHRMLVALAACLAAGSAWAFVPPDRMELPPPGSPDAPSDPRYVGPPARDAQGRIVRNRAMLRQFARDFPCPSTGRHETSCPGWDIDHVIPLACGGADKPKNLQWLPDAIKSAAGKLPKDRWEIRVYCWRWLPRRAP